MPLKLESLCDTEMGAKSPDVPSTKGGSYWDEMKLS